MKPVRIELETAEGRRLVEAQPPDPAATLSDWLRRQQLPLNTRCGQRGLCDGCMLELVSGRVRHLASGKTIASDGHLTALRACEYAACDDAPLVLRVPARSLAAQQAQVVTHFKLNVTHAHDPLFRRLRLEAGPGAGCDAGDLATQVSRALGGGGGKPVRVAMGLKAPAAVPGRTQGELWAGVEYRGDHWLVSSLAGAPGPALGVAVDIGTTTVALFLVDLSNGRILAKAAAFNRQIDLGDNVLTRINLCFSDSTQVRVLQRAIIGATINPLLAQALASAKASAEQVVCVSLAGNTTMLHLAAGVDPSSMGYAPFTPVFLEHRVLSARELGLVPDADGQIEAPAADAPALPWPYATAEGPAVHLLPSAAAYIGADLTAGVLACGLVYDNGPSLLVDVGTNGEIILKHGRSLLGCATAAGPAFEGAGLSSGMRAADGAIERIRVNPDELSVEMKVIGDAPPVGVCGSAYIDFMAEGLRSGLLDISGRYSDAAQSRLGDQLFRSKTRGLNLKLAPSPGSEPTCSLERPAFTPAAGAASGAGVNSDESYVRISEGDIAALIQAKAAIAAGILTLLANLNLEPKDVKTVYLAGGFGLHIDIPAAIECGLLPGFTPEQVQLVGNTSLAGAYLALLDRGVLDEIVRQAAGLKVVELNLDPNFESRYIDQLMLAP